MSSLELRHPESELLLPYLDGELPARKARQVRRHVEACWQCRTELEELEKTVGECVRYRKKVQEAPLVQPPQPWSDLSQEFARIDRATGRTHFWSRPLIRWTVLAAASAVLVAATLTLRIWDRHPETNIAEPPQNTVVTQLGPPSASPAGNASAPASTQPLPRRAPERERVEVHATVGDELRAVAALHQLGADLGDPVEVAREGERVVVRGAGVSLVRERQIRAALVSLPNVEVQFPQAGTLPAPSPAETPAAPQPAPVPTALQNRLEAQLGGHTQFEDFSAQLLDHQEAVMARVYALRRLANEFPAETENQMSADNQALLRRLAQEHMAAMSREIAAIRGAAAPVLQALSGEGQVPGREAQAKQGANWQAAAQEVFVSGRQVDSLLATLLGASAPEPGGADNLPAAVLNALAQLQASVQQCELLLMH
jgi:hypothetical protein